MPEKLKVGIVGAGLSGLYLGWKLSEQGHQVTIFEKKDKIGKEVCSGLISERILEFIPESQKLIKNQIKGTLIHFPRKSLKVEFSKKFLVMSHFELDNLVAGLAEDSGGKIILNHNINSTPEGFERIIGCDGANSIIRKKLKLAEPKLRLAIQGFLKKKDYSNYLETWATKSGFLWKIPRGEEIEYGIIEQPLKARKALDKFLKERNIQLESVKAGLVPQGFLIPSHSSITLCGDAAGLCKPWSGGGIIWGLIAADILLKNFPNFLKYQKEMKKTFLPKIIFSKIATKIVYFFGFNFPWILPRNIKIEGDFLI